LERRRRRSGKDEAQRRSAQAQRGRLGKTPCAARSGQSPLARFGFLIGVRQHAWIFRVGVGGRDRHAEILSCFTSFSFLSRSVQRDSLLEGAQRDHGTRQALRHIVTNRSSISALVIEPNPEPSGRKRIPWWSYAWQRSKRGARSLQRWHCNRFRSQLSSETNCQTSPVGSYRCRAPAIASCSLARNRAHNSHTRCSGNQVLSGFERGVIDQGIQLPGTGAHSISTTNVKPEFLSPSEGELGCHVIRVLRSYSLLSSVR